MIIYRETLWIFTSLFLLGMITEGLDGRLARKWDVTSKFGEMLDHIADFTNLLTTFVLLYLTRLFSIWILIAYCSWSVFFVILTTGPLGKKWFSPKVWAYIGLTWWTSAILINGTLIAWLMAISYPKIVLAPCYIAALIFFWFSREGCLRWRDLYLNVLRKS